MHDRYESPTWDKHLIANLNKPIQADFKDVDGDGFSDFVLGHNYGTCAFDCGPTNGSVSWLRNPLGDKKYMANKPWEVYFIGNNMASHRTYFGRFSNPNVDQVFEAPIVGYPGGLAGETLSTVLVDGSMGEA